MKLLQTIILILFSVMAKGQGLSYTLAYTSSKKWIGVDKTSTLNGPNSLNLIFHTNHTVEEIPVNSHKNTVIRKWLIIHGEAYKDDNIEGLCCMAKKKRSKY